VGEINTLGAGYGEFTGNGDGQLAVSAAESGLHDLLHHYSKAVQPNGRNEDRQKISGSMDTCAHLVARITIVARYVHSNATGRDGILLI
jgi:hypothetical protein